MNGFTTKAKATPWRLAIISDNLNDLVNNTLVTNVSDPVKEEIRDASGLNREKQSGLMHIIKKQVKWMYNDARRFFEASRN